MEKRLQYIPEDVIETITSEQVILDVNAVVKELLENSLDAGADNISVHVINGGTDEIVILDLGA